MDLLGKFKWHFKRVARAIWLEPEPLLTPVAKPRARLHCLGFHTVLACPSLLPWWPEDEVTAVTGRILQLRGHCPASHLQDLRAGTLALRPQAISLQRAPPWAERPTELQGPCAPPSPFFVLCPLGCGTQLCLAGKPKSRGWPKAHCRSCAKDVRLGRARCIARHQALSGCACGQGQPAEAAPPAAGAVRGDPAQRSILGLLRGSRGLSA